MRTGTFLFILIEAALYLCYMMVDCTGKGSIWLSEVVKYGSIVICFLYSNLMWHAKRSHSHYICFSYFFLIISDYFLLFTNSYAAGILSFCCVQICFYSYINSIRFHQTAHFKQTIRLLLADSIITVIAMILLNKSNVAIDLTTIFAFFYGVLFLVNAILALYLSFHTTSRSFRVFTLGLILYLICDLNVGIYHLSDYFTITGTIFHHVYHFSAIAMWMFYLPGILLITLSNTNWNDCIISESVSHNNNVRR